MSLLGLLIFGAVAGGAAIKNSVENSQAMSKPVRTIVYRGKTYYLYADLELRYYIKGDGVYEQVFEDTEKIVGLHSKRVYVNKRLMYLDKIDEKNEQKRQEAMAEGKLAYEKMIPSNSLPKCTMNYNQDLYVLCECETGRVIRALYNSEDGHKKVYAKKEDPMSSSGEKVIITKEEYENLKKSRGLITKCYVS